MKIFIGLGNFEEKYIGTRHNIGRDFLIWFAKKNNFSDFIFDKYINAKISKGSWGGEDVEMVLPETFMNLSGESVSKYLKNKDFSPDSIYIFHDDIDMNFGDVKLTTGESGSGGHNGVQSIFDHLKRKDFNRVKIGIIPKRLFVGFKKPKGSEVPNFVLKKFSIVERGAILDLFDQVVQKIK